MQIGSPKERPTHPVLCVMEGYAVLEEMREIARLQAMRSGAVPVMTMSGATPMMMPVPLIELCKLVALGATTVTIKRVAPATSIQNGRNK